MMGTDLYGFIDVLKAESWIEVSSFKFRKDDW